MNMYKPGQIRRLTVQAERRRRNTQRVGLFCNARDEKHIKEWAAHHLLIGFDMIILFDHKSVVPLRRVFTGFDKRVIVQPITLADGNIKIPLMNQATTLAKLYNMDWFIYLDADEFLMFSPVYRGVKHFLNTHSNADSVGVNWLMFGSNYLVKEPENGLLLEHYIRSDPMLNQHVKTFVRPHAVRFSDNPHYYRMIDPQKMVGITYQPLRGVGCFNPLSLHYTRAPAFVAHYVFQSEETYRKRKVVLPADDGTCRADMGKQIHAEHNGVINMYPQRYVQGIKQMLRID